MKNGPRGRQGHTLKEPKTQFYSRMTVPPNPSKTALIFSASSFGTFSLITPGTPSTNFFALPNYPPKPYATRLDPGINPFISLIIFAFADASNFSNFIVKLVFSSTTTFSSTTFEISPDGWLPRLLVQMRGPQTQA
jgi:hypothetical protein